MALYCIVRRPTAGDSVLPNITVPYNSRQILRVVQTSTKSYRLLQTPTGNLVTSYYYRIFQSIAEYCRVLQYTTECFRVLHCTAAGDSVLQNNTAPYSPTAGVLQRTTEYCSALERGCYRVLQSLTEPWRMPDYEIRATTVLQRVLQTWSQRV